MNICIISNFKQSGYGESTRPGQLAKYLRLLGHNILHICDWTGTINGVEHMQIVRDKWESSTARRTLSFIKNYWALSLFKPDLIYVHQFNNAKWATQTKLFKCRKIIFDAHTSAYLEQASFKLEKNLLQTLKNQENNICNSVDFIIAASEETKNFLEETYDLPSSKLEVVGNATDIAPIQNLEVAKSEKFICVTTLPQDGFLSNKIALEMLLQIAIKTYEINKEVEFHIIGGGQMPPSLIPNVVFNGYVDDLRAKILSGTICLMPFPENAVCGGARNKFCDYIALGKLVITTPEGLRGMEILKSNINCIVANDVEQFVLQINTLSKDYLKIQTIEEQVFKIRGFYNWKDRAKSVETIFNRVINK